MAAYTSKIYIVQKFNRKGEPGDIIAVKLTFAAAHAIAKEFAPAKVVFAIADKDVKPNIPVAQ